MLAEFLDNVAPLESPDESQKRNAITRELESLAFLWLSGLDSGTAMVKLLTFGSSILGVVTNESDLDTVLLLPSFISREKFFHSFVDFLRATSSSTLEIESMMPVPDAHVPVLKMVVNGLPVDILPCRIPLKELRQLLSTADPVTGQLDFTKVSLRDMDHPSLLALNGVRVGRTLVDSIRAGRMIADDEIVEQGEDRLQKFQLCLRAIKFWAGRRGIYSNAMGFFGGVTWAILLVKTCLAGGGDLGTLLMDSLSAEELLTEFFRQWNEWSWGVGSPVTLRDFSVDASLGGANSHFAVSLWDPLSNEVDKKSFMPILTPVCPFMNSTFNTTTTTMKILTEEFRRAVGQQGTSAEKKTYDLSFLCEKIESWKPTPTFPLSIELCFHSTTSSSRLLFVWESLIQSKLRVLVYHLERLPGVVCRPFPDPVVRSNGGRTFFIRIEFVDLDPQTKTVHDFNYAVGQFHGALRATLDARPDRDELTEFCRLDIRLGGVEGDGKAVV